MRLNAITLICILLLIGAVEKSAQYLVTRCYGGSQSSIRFDSCSYYSNSCRFHDIKSWHLSNGRKSNESGFFMSKRVRKKDVDRISTLPDAILSHILSFLSTLEAVRTSILSTRWRYLFALVPNLDFNYYDYFLLYRKKQKPKCSTTECFESFVDRVMFYQHTASIEKFRLKCGLNVDSSRVCGWISAALWRGVQHLNLTIFNPKFTTLPGVLFTCRTLVTLKLDIKFVLNVPNDVCFPNLKTLHLKSIEYLNDDSVKRLFSSCISLEDMVMEECYLANISNFIISHHWLKRLTIISSESHRFTSNYWLGIDAPMLVHFKYRDYEAAGYSLENLQSLVSADIDFILLKGNSITNNYHQADATPFFRWIRNVQSLILSSSTLMLLLGCEPVPVFPNMVQLKIYRPYYCSIRHYDNQEKGLTTLLRGSPQLENLSFDQHVFSYVPEELLFCLFKLKTIELSEFEAGKDCIEKAKYFLKNARVVEKLTISTRYLAERVKLKISEELLVSPKKSKQCCILIV